MQDAVLGTLNTSTKFEHRTVGALQAYLRESVVNRIRDLIRRVQRRGVAVEPPKNARPAALASERAILHERLEQILEALQRLRPTDRQAIIWRVELGYSTAEIARRLGRSRKRRRGMTVSRALARLGTEMNMKQPDPPA